MKGLLMRFELNRRDFVKLTALGIGSLATQPLWWEAILPDFPTSERLGRVVPEGLRLHARPDPDSAVIRRLTQNEILPVERTLVGANPYRVNQNWVETPEGYAWSPEIQPVRNMPNEPMEDLPVTSLGAGMWAEVTVPYVNLELGNPPARAPWLVNRLEAGYQPRFFYSQIVWVDQLRTKDGGQVQYRLNERYGYGDRFWAAAEGLRPLSAEEMTPLMPGQEDKRIQVNIARQTLSCFEGSTEVYFCRVSTGALYNVNGERVDAWGTPLGRHRIWRKAVSLPLSGGSAAFGWDLPAVGWISLFVGTGVAVHSTYWHNNYGVPTSRGCVNAQPDDAKWIFRWTLPQVPFDPGDVTVSMPGGTQIEVLEA